MAVQCWSRALPAKYPTATPSSRDPDKRRRADTDRVFLAARAEERKAVWCVTSQYGGASSDPRKRAESSQDCAARFALGLHFEPVQILARHPQHAFGIGLRIAGFLDIDHQRIGFDTGSPSR